MYRQEKDALKLLRDPTITEMLEKRKGKKKNSLKLKTRKISDTDTINLVSYNEAVAQNLTFPKLVFFQNMGFSGFFFLKCLNILCLLKLTL